MGADFYLERLLYRAWQVCQTSNEVLVEKLGLDIPPPPEVTLEEVTAHEIRIAWKQPDFHNSIHKHIIQVNGAKGNLSIFSHIPIPTRLTAISGRIQARRNGSRNFRSSTREHLPCLRSFSQRRQFPDPECHSPRTNKINVFVPVSGKCHNLPYYPSLDSPVKCWFRSPICPRYVPRTKRRAIAWKKTLGWTETISNGEWGRYFTRAGR